MLSIGYASKYIYEERMTDEHFMHNAYAALGNAREFADYT